MKKEIIIFGLLIIIFFMNDVSAVVLYPFSTENKAKIDSVEQYNTIKGSGMYSEMMIVGSISNESIDPSSTKFTLTILPNEGEGSLNITNPKVIICDWKFDDYQGDYTSYYNHVCKKEIIPLLNYSEKSIEIEFNLESFGFGIKIDYEISSDFVMDNGNYEIAWLRTGCNDNIACPKEENVQRYLKMPLKSSILEDWSNFNIKVRDANDKWVLKTIVYGDAIVWYRDSQREMLGKAFWMFLGILFSLLAPSLLKLIQN